MIKQFIRRAIASIVSSLSKTSVGLFVCQQIIDTVMDQQREVHYRSHRLTFTVPNWLNNYRIDTFASKEPETLEWIDSIPVGSVLWDVGANVGLYSIYAAKAQNCRVYAFEPSVFNLELLARNIFLNKLQNQITIIPLAVSDQLGLSFFKMSTTTWGGRRLVELERVVDDLRLVEPAAKPQHVRSPVSDAASILGSWKGHASRLRLRGDGTVAIVTDEPFRFTTKHGDQRRDGHGVTGRYAARDDLMFIEWEDNSKLNYRWRLRGDKLLLTDHEGHMTQLVRLSE